MSDNPYLFRAKKHSEKELSIINKQNILMNILELSEQEIGRRESLQQLRDMGIEPYPAAEYVVDAWSDDIRENFVDLPTEKDAEGNEVPGTPTPENSRMVSIAGRMMGRRIMGKAGFAELQDSKGRIQVYVKRDEICPGEDKELYNTVFKKLLDIGDFIGVKGYVFRTKTGEISVHAQELTLLSKSLKPLPIVKTDADGNVYDKFDDPELRYRQRYVDLVVNEGVKETFLKRATIIRTSPEHSRWCFCTSIHHSFQRSESGYVYAYRYRALSEAPYRRWFRGCV